MSHALIFIVNRLIKEFENIFLNCLSIKRIFFKYAKCAEYILECKILLEIIILTNCLRIANCNWIQSIYAHFTFFLLQYLNHKFSRWNIT